MEQKSDIASRLHSERQRLALTQDEFADAGGISKRAYCNYENGSRDSGADFLARVAKAGADVQYILTGIGSANLSAITGNQPPDDGAEGVVDVSLSPRASVLLADYERCTEPMKDAIDRTVRAMANRSKKEMALGVMQIGESLFQNKG